MNKAILIVICDFLVSAMLTMMTGMVPGHTGGTGVGLDENTTKVLLSELSRRQIELENIRARLREAITRSGSTPDEEDALRRATGELAANLAQQSKLRASLNATVENTGVLDAKKLRARLDDEKIRRLELEIELRDAGKDLQGSRKDLERVSRELREKKRDFAVQSRELSRTRDSLSETSKALVEVTKENVRTKSDLARSESRREAAENAAKSSGEELNSVRKDLQSTSERLLDETRRHGDTRSALARKDSEARERQRELSIARESLRKLNTAHSKTEGQLGALQVRFAETTGKLAVREQDNASLKDLATRLERELLVARLKAKESDTQSKMMQETLKSTVQELSAARQKAQQTEIQNARLDAALETTKKLAQVARTAAPEKHQVFERYAAAVVKIESTVSEKAFIGERSGKTTSFYPLVSFGKRVVLIGAVNRFAGDWEKVLDFKNVTRVDMLVSSPFEPSGNQRQRLNGAMVVNGSQPHLAAFAFSSRKYRPLTVVSVGKLQENGVEGLFLFKNSGFEANTRLDGRVSLVMDKNNPALFIRNSGRSGNELDAEAGDLILTRSGEFVGIVAERVKVNRVEGGRVPLIRDVENFWGSGIVVPLDKSAGERYFSRFGSQMRKVREKVKGGYARY
ncbi:MAG: hypothetical protein IKC82_04730 [Lentisphaeria bacterium]|nr:hypothetical protein [Lentisphaeria bacterium]